MKQCTKAVILIALIVYSLFETTLWVLSLATPIETYLRFLILGAPIPVLLGWLAESMLQGFLMRQRWQNVSRYYCSYAILLATSSIVFSLYFSLSFASDWVSADKHIIYNVAVYGSQVLSGAIFQVAVLLLAFISTKVCGLFRIISAG